MTALDFVPVAQITARAQRIRFLPVVLSLAALPFLLLGFAVAGCWYATKWCSAAFMEGFDRASRREVTPAVRRGAG